MATKAELQEELGILKKVNSDLIQGKPVANGDSPPDLAKMNIYERIHWIRDQRDYLKKKLTGSDSGFASAVAHSELIRAVRPLFQSAKVIWFPIKSTLLHSTVVDTQHGPALRGEFHTVYRIQSVDDSADFMEMEVHSTGWSWRFDGYDKGPGKASTYADKYLLLRLCGLEYGDDPDHTPRHGLETEVDHPTTQKIKEIRDLLTVEAGLTGGMEVDRAEAQAVAQIARSKGRVNVKNIFGLPEEQLDEWIVVLKKRAQDRILHAPPK